MARAWRFARFEELSARDIHDLFEARLAVFVVERVFQLVQTDEERIAAADVAIRVHVDGLRARFRPRE